VKLKDFLKLPPEHTIEFDDGRELHRDIALNGATGLSEGQAKLLEDYLAQSLLYQTVEPTLIENLEAALKQLQERRIEKNVK